MGKPGASGALLHRSNVIPEIDRNQRQAMVFRQDDFKAIGQRVFLISNHRRLERRGLCGRKDGEKTRGKNQKNATEQAGTSEGKSYLLNVDERPRKRLLYAQAAAQSSSVILASCHPPCRSSWTKL